MKKLKRFVAAVMVTAMIGSLCACGEGNSDSSSGDTTQEQTEGSSEEGQVTTEATVDTGSDEGTEDETEVSSEGTIWELQDMDIDANIPTHSVTDATNSEGKDIRLVGAELCNPVDETLEALKANEWLKSLGVMADTHSEFGHSQKDMLGEVGWYYRYEDGLGVYPEGGDVTELSYNSTFRIFYQHDTRNVKGVNYVALYFDRIDATDPTVQENVQSIIKEIFGEELGEFLLFAKDQDPDYLANYPNNLNVWEELDDMIIGMKRTLDEDSISFIVQVKPYNENTGGYTAGHEPDFSSFRALPEDVFGGDAGGQALNNVDLFSAYRTSTNFVTDDAYMIEYEVKSTVCEDGRQFEQISYRYDKTIDSALWLEYNVGFDGDELINFGFGTGISQAVDHSKSNDENLSYVNAALSSFFGEDVSIAASDIDDMGSGKATVDTEIFGVSKTISLDIAVDGQAYWKVTSAY